MRSRQAIRVKRAKKTIRVGEARGTQQIGAIGFGTHTTIAHAHDARLRLNLEST